MAGITADKPCPQCLGEMWDNRTTKKNPKQPDFACKDRDGCGHAIWPPKEKKAEAQQQKAEPKPVVPIETLSAEYGALLRSIATKLNEMAPQLNDKLKPTFADAQAAAATIWISHRKQS